MTNNISPAYKLVFPLGTKYFPSRFTITTMVFSGSFRSIKWLPSSRACSVTLISEVTDFISSENSTSKFSSALASSGSSARPNHFATSDNEVPCTTNETKVQKNTILNIKREFGISEANTIIAKIIGTAPRKPTQEIKVLSFPPIFLNGNKHKNTLKGRVMKIILKLMINPGTIMGISSEGLMSSPRVRNISNWLIQAMPSKKFRDERLCANWELPMTNPPTYTARYPFPLMK